MNLFQWLNDIGAKNRRPVVCVPDGPKTSLIRIHYRFSGRVQGVGFRYEAKVTADQLDLTGWVRNEDDGTVTAEVEGPESHINEFLRVMRAVPRFDITDIQIERVPLSETEPSFRTLN